MTPPYRIEWLDAVQAEIRRLDRPAALQVFDGILRYSRLGGGDVTPLHGDLAGTFRLRVCDYRVLSTLHENTMRIFGVRHRSEAYC